MLLPRLLADAVLMLHALFTVFVVFGLLLILIGLHLKWRWVRNFWFRTAHLLAIGLVAGQAWSGIICPLTILESHYRQLAGQAAYPGSFMAYWVHDFLFWEAEPWVFSLAYTAFGGLVLFTFFFGSPHWPSWWRHRDG